MKNWKVILLVAGILLLIAAFAVYAARIASCYPPAKIIAQYSPEYVKGYRESCKLDSPLTTQFSDFLVLFIPGIILFSAYWLLTRPRVKIALAAFILLGGGSLILAAVIVCGVIVLSLLLRPLRSKMV
ncbi:MAG: hypothetical protein NTV38_02385 [Chloroflexi bacterium]|nr:hypothetical protein [Chloroflexota bacterium]